MDSGSRGSSQQLPFNGGNGYWPSQSMQGPSQPFPNMAHNFEFAFPAQGPQWPGQPSNVDSSANRSRDTLPPLNLPPIQSQNLPNIPHQRQPGPAIQAGVKREREDDDVPPPRPAPSAAKSKPKPKPKGKGKGTTQKLKTGAQGRASGAKNYSTAECTKLVDIYADELPAGPDQHASCNERYNRWALKHGFPDRDTASTRAKFNKIAKCKKPTGNAVPPDYVLKAKQVLARLHEVYEIGDIDDPDSDSDVGGDDDSGNESEPIVISDSDDAPAPKASKAAASRAPSAATAPAPAQSTAQQRRPSVRRNTSAQVAQDLAAKLTSALDPAVTEEREQRREDLRAAQRNENFFLTSLHNDLRSARQELRAANDKILTLSTENSSLKLQVEMLKSNQRRPDYDDYPTRGRSRSRGPFYRSYRRSPSHTRRYEDYRRHHSRSRSPRSVRHSPARHSPAARVSSPRRSPSHAKRAARSRSRSPTRRRSPFPAAASSSTLASSPLFSISLSPKKNNTGFDVAVTSPSKAQ